MTKEEKAEEYFCEHCENSFEHDNGHCSNCSKWDYFIAGLTEGWKEKWHDLRKDPNDLPEEGIEVLVLYSNYYDDNGLIVNETSLRYEVAQYVNDEEDLTEWYWVDARTDDMVHEVIAWCKLPKFKVE